MLVRILARHLRLAAVAFAALWLFGAMPALAQSPLPEPTRGGNNADMWRSVRQGERFTVSIPNKQAGVLVQSEGETWRNFRNGPVSTYGTWLMLGMIVVLALFFAIRGRIRIESGWSGRLIVRFTGFERFVHWLTAASFILLAVTGLNILYGRYVLLPLIGAGAFSGLTLGCKYVHNFTSFAFMLGVLLMFVIWVRHNLPTRADLVWLARGGGLFTRGSHPPAHKFNAGQKLLFWAVVLMGGLLSLSGLLLMFPLWWADLHQTQLAQLGHAVLAVLMIAGILAHIYIGTLGMEGAFAAMGSGLVDENWAREHHGLWVAEMKGEPPPTDDHAPRERVGGRRAARPA